jgi:hypothetical protein
MALSDEVERRKQQLVEQAGKAMLDKTVKGVIDDLTLSPEEKAKRAADDEAGSKTRLVKLVLGVTAALVAGIVILKVLAAVWMYGIALIVLVGLGTAGYLVARPKLEAMKQQRLEAATKRELERTADDRAKAADEAKAAAERSKAAAAQKLEDDLARLKRQV